MRIELLTQAPATLRAGSMLPCAPASCAVASWAADSCVLSGGARP